MGRRLAAPPHPSPALEGRLGGCTAGDCGGHCTLRKCCSVPKVGFAVAEVLPGGSPAAKCLIRRAFCIFFLVSFFFFFFENEGLPVPLNAHQLTVYLAFLQGLLSSPRLGLSLCYHPQGKRGNFHCSPLIQLCSALARLP